jgi:hypothetical protein
MKYLFRGRDTELATSATDRAVTEPFLSSVAGGLFLVTVLTVACSAALTDSERTPSKFATATWRDVAKEPATSITSTVPSRALSVQSVGALAIFCVVASLRFRTSRSAAETTPGT